MIPPLDWLGYAAASLTTLSFVPQVWHTVRTRDVSGISLGMYCAFTAGIVLWLVYGALAGLWPLIVANCITLILALCIVAMKVLHGRPPGRPGSQERTGLSA
jgi:MtN3 and saliva related transmembrane protein